MEQGMVLFLVYGVIARYDHRQGLIQRIVLVYI